MVIMDKVYISYCLTPLFLEKIKLYARNYKPNFCFVNCPKVKFTARMCNILPESEIIFLFWDKKQIFKV